MLGKHLLMASIAVVSSALFLGLAVLGWGGFGAFLAHPPFIAVLVVFVLLLGAAMFTQGNLNPGEREDRGNRWVIWAIMGLSLALAYVPAYTDRIGLWTLDGEAMRWIGVVLGAIGGTLRILPVFVLGRRFSGLVAIQKEHRLVTTGIYATIRPPELSRPIDDRGGLGAGVPLRGGAHHRGLVRADYPRPDQGRGAAAGQPVRRRIRGLSGTNIAPHSGCVLGVKSEAHPGFECADDGLVSCWHI